MPNRNQPHRRAFTVTELIVGCGLLATLASIVGPLSFAAARLTHQSILTNQIHDELANQLERFTVLSEADVERGIKELALSPSLADSIPNADLTATRFNDQDGDRITIVFTSPPESSLGVVTLTGWMTPAEIAQP